MDAKKKTIALIGSATIDGTSGSKQGVFVVPSNLILIPFSVCFHSASASLASLTDIDIGGDTNASDWIQQVSLASMGTNQFSYVFQPEQAAGPPITPIIKPTYSSGSVFGLKLNATSTATLGLQIDLFGHLIDSS